MRIVQLLAGYDSAGLSGSVIPLVRALRQRGHDVEELFINLKSRRVEDLKRSVESFAQAVDACRGADVIHVHTPLVHLTMGTLLRRDPETALVGSRHATSIPNSEEWLKALANTDIVVPVAAYLAQEFYEIGVPAGKLMPVHNGLELNLYRGDREDAKAELGISAEQLVVGFTGRLSWVKNLQNTIGAVATAIKSSYRDARFIIFGAGVEGKRLDAMIQQLGYEDVVTLAGYLPREKLIKLLPAIDIAVHYSWTEACSVSLLEHLAVGAAVVASDVPGNREVVGEAGVLVPADAPPALSTAVQLLLDDVSHRVTMQSRAVSRSEMFDINLIAGEMETVYATAVDRRRAAAAVSGAGTSQPSRPARRGTPSP